MTLPPGTAPQSPTQGPLSPEHYAQFEAAQRRGKKLRKVAGVARFNGWTTGLFAGSALIFAWIDKLMGGGVDYVALAVGAALTIVTINEFRGAAKARRVEPGATTLLGFNQLFLLAAITCYCLWNMFMAPSITGQSSGDPEVDRLLQGFTGVETTVKFAVYGLVIAGSVIAQGMTALYYFQRGKTMREYLRETPPWIVQLQRRER
jgi:hypothetical protein